MRGRQATSEDDLVAPPWWHDLYRRRYAATVRLAGLVLGDFHAGEEIAQDAFARLFEAGAAVRDPDRYLTGVVVISCRAFRRRAALRRSTVRRLPTSGDDGHLEDRVTDRAALRAALARLPMRQREALVLRYYAGLSEADTAAAMRVSAGTVKTHLRRARASLSEDMEVPR